MDVADWLRGLDLERYEATFRENDVSAEVLFIRRQSAQGTWCCHRWRRLSPAGSDRQIRTTMEPKQRV
jgi:SAM domain (Sterile alpha motif)